MNELNSFCRSCLSNSSQLINLSDSLNISDKTTIFDGFVYCTSLEIDENCFSWICLICVENLKIAFEFKKQCVESDLKLKEISRKSVVEESFKNEDEIEVSFFCCSYL